MNRLIAIGDIHGSSYALGQLLKAIDPQPTDTIVTLGDYVDRGIDSKGVLDMLIALSIDCHLVPILGNHDVMMFRARNSSQDLYDWFGIGGQVALESYGEPTDLRQVPETHFRFLNSCVPFFETKSHIFTHANYDPMLPFAQQSPDMLRWKSLRDYVPGPHISGKTVVVGHTPQPKVLDLGYLICIDTGCAIGGRLTALDVETGQQWQTSEDTPP